MNDKRISKAGFLQTIANYAGLRSQTVSEWLGRDRSINHRLAMDIAKDLEGAMNKVMEKWAKNPRFIAAIEKTKKHHLHKGIIE